LPKLVGCEIVGEAIVGLELVTVNFVAQLAGQLKER
jgi:hypothetical protein